MKKVTCIFIVLLGMLFARNGTHVSAAIEETTVTTSNTEVSTTAPDLQTANKVGITETVEYLLPYPGILPDHPLYFLKKFRDTILERLIADPIKKAEFYILQGDKRLNMGIFLVAQSKLALAETTVSKGEKYLGNVVQVLTTQKTAGNPIPGYITDRLEKSLLKHEEVLTDLIARTSDPVKAGFTGSLEFVKNLQKEIAKLK